MRALSNDREDIKAAIRKKHGSMTEFERARGLAKDSTRDVLRGKSIPRTAIAIASELDATIHELFPGRFLSLNRDTNTSASRPQHLNLVER